MRALTIALVLLIPFSLYATAQPNSGGLEQRVAELEAQVAAMEEILQFVRVETEAINALAGPHWIIEGANVHVRSGSGSTADGCWRFEPDYPNCESRAALAVMILHGGECRTVWRCSLDVDSAIWSPAVRGPRLASPS